MLNKTDYLNLQTLLSSSEAQLRNTSFSCSFSFFSLEELTLLSSFLECILSMFTQTKQNPNNLAKEQFAHTML